MIHSSSVIDKKAKVKRECISKYCKNQIMPPVKNISTFNIILAVLIFQFSANTAKNGPNTPAGAIRAKVTKLVQNVDSVISQVSQPTPIFWIHSPKRETVLLKKYLYLI